jgi:succinyl-CoA synthetase beta subunit
MKLHEHQAKEVIAKAGVAIQEGKVGFTVDEVVQVATNLYDNPTGKEYYIVKAQIHAGGRGKGGGVKLAKSLAEVREKAEQIMGMKLVTKQTGPEGKIVRRILVAKDVYYPGARETKEYYFSITLDRLVGRLVVMASAEGGMDIEEVAEKFPEKIIKEWVDPVIGLETFQARKIAFKLGLDGNALNGAVDMIMKVYKAYMDNDCSLAEINPMLRTSDDKVIAVDCKMDIDENALYRQPELAAMRDLTEEDALEIEASEYGLNYINLTGNVGCMVNGAGLAMATMDMIKLAGGFPANFLDVGGKANAETVEAAFRIILKDPAVKVILVNIFGGIVRCDRVANGVVEAYKNIGDINVPIIVRLQGTNAEEAAAIIDQSGLKVTSAITLAEAAQKVKEALSHI